VSSSEPWQSDLEQMYREMYPTLYAYALRILKDHALAEEAIQDTFCIACAKREQALSNPKPRGWLMLTLKHVMQNMLRAQRKVQRLLFLTAGEEQPAEAPELLDVDVLFGDVSNSEDFRLLKRIALDQCTIVELAQDLGISVEACKKRVQRARKRLQKKLKV
jgi:RNA polymerase sigma factor (sigma-70 family)